MLKGYTIGKDRVEFKKIRCQKYNMTVFINGVYFVSFIINYDQYRIRKLSLLKIIKENLTIDENCIIFKW